MALIDLSFPYLIANEGGFVNNPRDPGGATNMGITQADLSRWRAMPCSTEDVKNLDRFEARRIYLFWFWTPLKLDQIISQSIATCIFDESVNMGLYAGAKTAQQVCNSLGSNLEVDSIMGPQTIAALNSCDPDKFITAFSSAMKAAYEQIIIHDPKMQTFYNGWMKRADRLLTLVSKPVMTKA